jgi:hypothetical protein
MKIPYLILIAFISPVPSAIAFPHASPHQDRHVEETHSDEDGNAISSQVGPDNSVIAWDRDQGFKLSRESLSTMGIETTSYSPRLRPTKNVLVFFQDDIGVYRLRDGWFRLVRGTVEEGQFVPSENGDLVPGDHVVSQGAGFLRITELDLAAGESSGHAH